MYRCQPRDDDGDGKHFCGGLVLLPYTRYFFVIISITVEYGFKRHIGRLLGAGKERMEALIVDCFF